MSRLRARKRRLDGPNAYRPGITVCHILKHWYVIVTGLVTSALCVVTGF